MKKNPNKVKQPLNLNDVLNFCAKSNKRPDLKEADFYTKRKPVSVPVEVVEFCRLKGSFTSFEITNHFCCTPTQTTSYLVAMGRAGLIQISSNDLNVWNFIGVNKGTTSSTAKVPAKKLLGSLILGDYSFFELKQGLQEIEASLG